MLLLFVMEGRSRAVLYTGEPPMRSDPSQSHDTLAPQKKEEQDLRCISISATSYLWLHYQTCECVQCCFLLKFYFIKWGFWAPDLMDLHKWLLLICILDLTGPHSPLVTVIEWAFPGDKGIHHLGVICKGVCHWCFCLDSTGAANSSIIQGSWIALIRAEPAKIACYLFFSYLEGQ